jgi:hypothetical protein
MTESDDRRLSNTANTARDDAEILEGDGLDDDHVPAPAGHAPRIDVEQPDPDSTTLRVSERGREEAWIEYDPVGVR